MRVRTSIDFYRATFWSTLGLTPLVACGGVTSGGTSVDTGAGAGGVGTGGVSFTGGAGSGGLLTDGAAGAGGAPQTTCRNPQPYLGPNGEATGLVSCDGAYGTFHRVARLDCPSIVPRPPSNPGSCQYAQCTQDSDCTAGPYGHCDPSSRGGPWGICDCSYGCVRDSDCATGEICLCGPAVGQCIAAGCSTDADCGGLLCITSTSTSIPFAFCDTPTIACQTPTDRCTTDVDCSSGPCVVMSSGQRACRDTMCGVGGFGRPFLVDGAFRLAPARECAGWSAEHRPEASALEPRDRAALAARWTELALGEHASIAANARFILELLSLGAPADLVRDANEAMRDEAVHAREAFALASAYAGHPVGPGALDVSGVLDASSSVDLVRRTILEGCIGETVAAVEAAEAYASAEDESVRAVLGRAASDEIRHAELAWRTIRWMLEFGDPGLLSDVAACVAESALAASRSASSSGPASIGSSEALRAHGILDPAVRGEIRRRVIVEVVEPCAQALLAQAGAGTAL